MHSAAFAEAARSERADTVTLMAATAVAQTAIDVLVDSDLREAIWDEFRGASTPLRGCRTGGRVPT